MQFAVEDIHYTAFTFRLSNLSKISLHILSLFLSVMNLCSLIFDQRVMDNFLFKCICIWSFWKILEAFKTFVKSLSSFHSRMGDENEKCIAKYGIHKSCYFWIFIEAVNFSAKWNAKGRINTISRRTRKRLKLKFLEFLFPYH